MCIIGIESSVTLYLFFDHYITIHIQSSSGKEDRYGRTDVVFLWAYMLNILEMKAKEEIYMDEICFVIQPFDNGKFDKRYEDVFKPAIIAAGLEPYRVDGDDLAIIPIETIEEKINAATICLADITLNNPNVWYEVGYAIAKKKTTVLICSDERSDKYPFDIRQRNILNYKTESQSDFTILKNKLTSRIKKLSSSNIIAPIEPINKEVDNIEGLSYQEVSLIASILATQDTPNEYISVWSVKEQMKKSGLNELAFNISVRKLLYKKFVELSKEYDYNGNEYNALIITEQGNDWILKNEDKFSYEYEASEGVFKIEETLPFD